MATLKSFKKNSAAIRDGEWVPLGPEYEDVEIHTRGMTDQYQDAQASRQRQAARSFGGDTGKLPVAVRRTINIECLIKHCLIDVRGLTHDDEQKTPVTFDEFCEILQDRDYEDLTDAVFSAVQLVGKGLLDDLKAASGNSGSSSATT